ncbi:olfactory receptor 2AP1-like [Hemicordylus capensis]|uniref:olfactory receptor 2AP1-like n=1 Tax=Hemicordylus capensis TaxID=884348 RepID=UPI00230219DF|nr:olfactory receptor 2AP1-like [Hemicordylus capensis]
MLHHARPRAGVTEELSASTHLHDLLAWSVLDLAYMPRWQAQHEANQTMINEFILLGFRAGQDGHIPLFLLLLVIYIVTISGNLLLILLVVSDQHLHTPMYYFLGNLSCLETFYSSAILPRMLYSLLTGDRSISFLGCIAQFYIFGILVTTECFLLAAMSFDRYLAICKPLHYVSHMNDKLCVQLTLGSWVGGCLAITITTSLMSQLVFCGTKEIDHFFCDFAPVINLSCSNTQIIEVLSFVLSSVCAFPPFMLTLASYVCIITSILKIPSTSRKQKAFSTCSSHLIVVTVFYGTLIIVYVLPKTSTLRELNKVFSLLYTILTPLINPIIYSLRNQDVKEALQKSARKLAAPAGI